MLYEDARPDVYHLNSVQIRAPAYSTASALAEESCAAEYVALGHLACQSDVLNPWHDMTVLLG